MALSGLNKGKESEKNYQQLVNYNLNKSDLSQNQKMKWTKKKSYLTIIYCHLSIFIEFRFRQSAKRVGNK